MFRHLSIGNSNNHTNAKSNSYARGSTEKQNIRIKKSKIYNKSTNKDNYVLDYTSKKLICIHSQSASDNNTNQYYYISPVNLSVDVLQYALENGNISYHESGYLGFVNQPSIVINKSPHYKDVRAQRNIFNLVIEKPEHRLLERHEYNAMLEGKSKNTSKRQK
jgi:hypothetical protein